MAEEARNFWTSDANGRATLARLAPNAAGRWAADLESFGAWTAGEVDAQADYTDRYGRPRLESYDRDGRLANRIVTNPLWDACSAEAYRRGAVGLNYGDDRAPYIVTFAMGYLLSHADVSLHCPVTMTGAVAYVLDRFAPPSVKSRWLPELTRRDGRALTGGTWATEQHGGSDVGATTTVARRDGAHWRLDGLKWFTSNVAGGIAVATARPEGAPAGSKGLGLYLVPTQLDDGAPNPMRIRRLKEKLGTVGVPTGEVDLTGTWAAEVAPPPEGFRLMMEALEFSRIHNALSSAGLHRRAFLEALAYAERREAFGSAIARYPMVQDELLKLLVQLEASVALAFEAAAAFDRAHETPIAEADNALRTWLRLAVALAKYRTAEEANVAARGAIELIGGNGYTADFVTPRLLRDAQVLTVWEGPANIQALELLRLLEPRYGAFELFRRRVAAAVEGSVQAERAAVRSGLAECGEALGYIGSDAGRAQRHARRLLALMADVLAGALLLEEATAGLAQGDARKSLVLRLFAQGCLVRPARRGVGPETEWVGAAFEPLVHGEPIEAGAVVLA
jgi:acyl-CoA dehydrogenase